MTAKKYWRRHPGVGERAAAEALHLAAERCCSSRAARGARRRRRRGCSFGGERASVIAAAATPKPAKRHAKHLTRREGARRFIAHATLLL